MNVVVPCIVWQGQCRTSFFWEGSTFSDAGSDGTQPASCVDIQNRQSTYSCRCPMYGACPNDVFCGLFYKKESAGLMFAVLYMVISQLDRVVHAIDFMVSELLLVNRRKITAD